LITARAGHTARLGHLLGPAGIRYVVVMSQTGPGHGAVIQPDPVLAGALARQLDLSISRIDVGAIVYANNAWLPSRAVVPAGTSVTATAGGSAAAAASSGAAVFASGVAGPVTRSRPAGPGTLTWAEAANAGWRASANGHELSRSEAFGWTNAFALPAAAAVGIHFHAGSLPGLLIWLELLLWAVALVGWWRTRARRRRDRSREVAA
jgi:hypothetical protein